MGSSSLQTSIVQVNGYKLSIIPNDTGISSELLMFKTHEPITTKLISKKLTSGMICLDIGSNIGYYALLEHKLVGKEGKVIAIEPSPLNFQYLQKNIKLQDTNNILCYNFAAGNKNGETKFLIYAESNGCMTIPDGEEAKFPGKVIKVPVKQIDTFLDEIKLEKVDFVRMDVEGYENYIFEGMQNTLKTHKPIIQIEVHINLMGKENSKKFLKMLQLNNYEVTYYIPRAFDVPIIGTLKDVKNFKINELLQMLEKNSLPSFFMLILDHSSKI